MAESYSVEAFLKADTSGFNKGFNDAISGLKNFKSNIKSVDTSPVRNAGKALQDTGNKMKAVGSNMKTVGKNASVYLTAPLLAAGGAATAGADKIDKAYRVIRVGTGATGDALESLEESFDNVFANVPDDADAVSSALATMNTLTGATEETLENLTTSVLDASRTLGEDGVTNSEAFGQAMKMWQIPAEEGVGELDKLYKLTQDYGVGLGEISGQLTTYGSVLSNAGFEMGESAELMASLESNGISVSRVMPGLNKSFRTWAGEGKNSRKELQKVIDKMKGASSETEALALATEIFGAEGAQRLTTAIRNGAIPSLDELGKSLENSKGLVKETTDETKTIGEEFQTLKNNAMTALQPIGDVLLDIAKSALPPIIEGVKKVGEWFSNLSPAIQKAVVVIGGMAAAFGPLMLVFGTLISFAGSVATSLGTLTTKFAPLIAKSGALKSILTGVLRVFTFFSNPITAVVAIVTTMLIPIFIKLYKENEKFREIVMAVWNQIKTVISTVVQTVVAFVMQIWGSLTAFWDEHGQMILQAAMNVRNVIKTVITTVMTIIWTIMQTLWPVIKSLIMSTWEAIKGVIQGAIDVILGIIQFFSALFTGNWSEMWEAVKRIVSGAVKLVWNFVQLWFVGKILKLGKTLFKSLTGIVKNLWSKVSGFFKGGVTKAKEVVSTGFDFIKSKISSVMNAVKSVVSSIWNSIKSKISSVMNAIKSTVSSIWNSIKGVITKVVNSIKTKVSNIFNSLKGVTSKAFNGVKNAVRTGINKALDIVVNIKKKFLDAGKNIVKSIAKGITGSIDKVKKAIGKVTSKIRDYLPFSPAKEGALRDIMKIQIPQSIAKSIDRGRNTAVKSMAGLAKAMNKEIQPSNIASQVDRVNRRSHNAMRYDYTNELTVSKQPAYINVAIGGQEFNAFVEDITNVQDRKTRVRRSFQ